jgi:predicted metal-binding membrane protein
VKTARSQRFLANSTYFLPLLGALIVLSWIALWAWGRSPYARFLSHHHLGDVHNVSLLLVFIAGWIVMIVAMMLPTSLPLVRSFHALTDGRRDQGPLLALLVLGYLSIWALFGVMIYTGDLVVHHALEHGAWLGANAWMLGAATVSMAGLYQFTPLKYRCLDKCRSPLSFIMGHWRGRQEKAQAFRLGAHHGLFCLGCCWSLMLLMFAVGTASLGWMLALATVMGVEKNVPWGKKISVPLGIFLLVWSVGLFMGIMPLGH